MNSNSGMPSCQKKNNDGKFIELARKKKAFQKKDNRKENKKSTKTVNFDLNQ